MMVAQAKRRRGAALILVLWLVAALSLTVLAGVRSVRQQTQGAGIDLERSQVEAVLDAARQLAVQAWLRQGGAMQSWGTWRMQLDGQTVSIEAIPSAGLLDVNVASDELLSAFLQRVGRLSPGEAMIMASRIRDYIDPDDAPSGVGGAEAAQYRAAGWPVMPRNGALADLSDLRMVLGMTPELYDIIAPYLGLNGQQRIALDAAPPALIDALAGQPGLGARIHSSSPEMRASNLQSAVMAELFSSSGKSDTTVKIITRMNSRQGHGWEREAWMDLRTRPDNLTPWTTLSLQAARRIQPVPQENLP